MSAVSFVVVPMDDRPCTYNFPQKLGLIYGAEMLLPDKSILGNTTRIADRTKIGDWLLPVSKKSSGVIISADTVGHGGLIPSRRHNDSYQQVLDYLAVIREIKKNNPQIPIYVCSSIMRISDSNENQEEKEYWRDYGRLLYRYSYLLDHYNLLLPTDYDNGKNDSIIKPKTLEKEINDLKEQIPTDILLDFLHGRQRNYAINKMLFSWVEEGVIDFLLICSDDSGCYGFNVIEKKLLQEIQQSKTVFQKNVIIYPGADEAISILLARMINHRENFVPRFLPEYSDQENAPQIITKYEGIPIKDTLANHVKAVGGELVEKSDHPDCTLYLHTPDYPQEDQYLNALYGIESRKVDSAEFLQKLAENFNSECVLLDLAYANGGDHYFMSKLAKMIDLKHLLSYSAWNTAGNSIGTALAHASIRLITRKKASAEQSKHHYDFLFERFIDDWLYQGKVRLDFARKNKRANLSNEEMNELAKDLLVECEQFLNNYQKIEIGSGEKISALAIKSVYFPWLRLFEIGVDCQAELSKN